MRGSWGEMMIFIGSLGIAVSDQFLCELAVRGINITEFDMDPEAGRKYSYLDDFKIIKTLSCGYHAK